MIRNKKGMTLIEILVVLVISSLIMVLAGSLILNSIGYFDKTASSDVDKQVTDSMATFVRDELIYASNVKISTTQPESTESEWHSLSLNKNGYLLKDDEQLYPDDYYNHKKLKLQASVYANTYRLDLKFSLMDGKDAKYTTSTTLELINVKTKILGDMVEESEVKANTEMVEISYETGNKIYYQKGTMGITDVGGSVPPADEQEGTVADEIKCKNELNTKEWGKGEKYQAGTFVEYNGVIYKAIAYIGDSSSTPDVNKKGLWKVIDRTFHERSGYEEDDVVEYPEGSKQYFICLEYYEYDRRNPVSISNTDYWEPIAKEDIEVDTTCDTAINEKTVAGELDRCPNGDVTKWEDVEKLVPGDYIEYDGDIYRYIGWLTIDNNFSLYEPQGNAGDRNFWKKIQEEWDEYSTYFKGDIVYYAKTGMYYIVKYDEWANDGMKPNDDRSAWFEIEDLDEEDAPNCRTTWW